MNKESDNVLPEDEYIYQSIYNAILEQKLLPGVKLKEEELSEIYNVGRTRVRKILAQLARDKVVVLISNRGAFVAKPTIEEAREVFVARRMIEGHLVRKLASDPSKRIRKVLEAQVKREQSVRDSGDFAASVREGGTFHLLLAELAGAKVLGEFLRELVSMTSLISAAFERGMKTDCELDEHRMLIKCIEDGRADDAVALMEAHIQGIESRLDLTPPRMPQGDLRKVLTAR